MLSGVCSTEKLVEIHNNWYYFTMVLRAITLLGYYKSGNQMLTVIGCPIIEGSVYFVVKTAISSDT